MPARQEKAPTSGTTPKRHSAREWRRRVALHRVAYPRKAAAAAGTFREHSAANQVGWLAQSACGQDEMADSAIDYANLTRIREFTRALHRVHPNQERRGDRPRAREPDRRVAQQEADGGDECSGGDRRTGCPTIRAFSRGQNKDLSDAALPRFVKRNDDGEGSMEQDHKAEAERRERSAGTQDAPRPDEAGKSTRKHIDPERLYKAIRFLKAHPEQQVRQFQLRMSDHGPAS
jgi:hypothetical protein